jgi:hypothetical protein
VVINARPLDEPSNPLLTLVLSFGPTLLLIGGFLWLFRNAGRQMGGGVFGMARAMRGGLTRPPVSGGLRSTMWPASMRPRPNSRRSSTS